MSLALRTVEQVGFGAWFGDPYPRAGFRAPYCDDERAHVVTPVGQACGFCDQAIEDGDAGSFVASAEGWEPMHRECSLRVVTGPVAALEGRCAGAGSCVPCVCRGESLRDSALATDAWVKAHGMPRL